MNTTSFEPWNQQNDPNFPSITINPLSRLQQINNQDDPSMKKPLSINPMPFQVKALHIPQLRI